jgi:adenylate kinase
MRIVLLGAPGSGKGTQSQRLAARHGIPQISSGDLLRAAVANGTALGLQAKKAMDRGLLVEDNIVLGMIRERLAESDTQAGFILDGFPRTIDQATALNTILREVGKPLNAVVLMEVDSAELVRRISGRRTCADCGRVFNVFTAPVAQSQNEPCPKTGAPHRLTQRADDNEATVAERLRVYDEKTRPLIDFYAKQGLLRTIRAAGDVDEITRRLESTLAEAQAPSAKAARKPRRSAARSVKKAAKRPSRKAVKSKSSRAAKTARKSVAKRGKVRTGARRSRRAPAKKSVGVRRARKTVARKAPRRKQRR